MVGGVGEQKVWMTEQASTLSLTAAPQGATLAPIQSKSITQSIQSVHSNLLQKVQPLLQSKKSIQSKYITQSNQSVHSNLLQRLMWCSLIRHILIHSIILSHLRCLLPYCLGVKLNYLVLFRAMSAVACAVCGQVGLYRFPEIEVDLK